MTNLVIEGLTKRYNGVLAVDNISFTVNAGEFVSLLGPSGCGKTTTLRCIAGFEKPDSGTISLGNKVFADAATRHFTPPNKRRLGMVFQSYAVWPHMTVMENVGYPLKVAGKCSKSEIVDRVHEKLQAVGLFGLEGRFPAQLSGGQQQRVALARALVMDPAALLFDEPLSNLDAKLRERMRFELVEIQSKLGIPAVYVTHDQSEAMVMSSRIVVMEQGKIAQEGEPAEIYERPRSRYVADFIGLSNFLPGKVKADLGRGLFSVTTALGDLVGMSDRPLPAGKAVIFSFRPEQVNVADQPFKGEHSLQIKLRGRYFLGPYTEYLAGEGECVIRIQTSRTLKQAQGGGIYIQVDPERCRILDEDFAQAGAKA